MTLPTTLIVAAQLRGRAADTLLDTYTVERKPHVSAVIDASIYLGQIICTADPAQAAERDHAFKSGTAEPPLPFPHLTAGLLARGADGLPAPLAGLLSPHGAVRWQGREGRWDDVVGLGWCVVVRDADPADLLRPDQLGALAALGAHLVGIAAAPRGEAAAEPCGSLAVDVDGRYAAFLDVHGGAAAMVVRPDFYVFGGVSEAAGLSGLVDALLAALAENGISVPATAGGGGQDRLVRQAEPAA